MQKGVLSPTLRAEAKSKPIGTRCVFTFKDGIGKARVVARGDRQTEDTYLDTYSPTMNVELLRLLLKIALDGDLNVVTFDIKRAYLNAMLHEDIYIEIPDGFHLLGQDLDRRKYVLKLERALYGLKQSGRAWYEELTETLKSFGFIPLKREPTVFIHPEKHILLATYVDDLVVVAETLEDIEFVRRSLLSKYELHDNGAIKRVLGLNIEKRPDGYLIHLTDMIGDLCERHGVTPDETTYTPVPANDVIELRAEGQRVDYFEYAGLLGSLLYIARMTRPDVLAAVVQLCQFQSAPRQYHMRKLKNILQYLCNTRHLGYLVRRSGSLELTVYADSSLANCHDQKSLMGCAVFVGDALISYGSRKSRLVTLSSNEAEIVAALAAMKDLLFFKKIICCLTHPPIGVEPSPCDACVPPPLFVDNSGVLSFAEKGFTRRTRYLDIEFYGLKSAADRGEFVLQYVKSAENRADMFTKNMCRAAIEDHREMIGIISPQPAAAPTA